MKVMYNVTGERRKELVKAVSEALGTPAQYRGAPSFAFEVGSYEIDRNGTLSAPVGHDVDAFEQLLAELYLRGFLYEARQDDSPPAPALESSESQSVAEHTGEDSFTIELPLNGLTDTQLLNLERLIASKATLISKALGAHTLAVIRTEDRLQFPWFDRVLDADELRAYAMLITAMVEMAKRQKRIRATERPVDSEKFAFRAFLLRLGFGGQTVAAERKLLLRNLSGPSAFPNAAKAAEHTERWRERRAQLSNQTEGDAE
ncbi:virulence protein [Eubacteriales bacterium OttesenSCG-928-N13]|nr:virulence protein [Eubacteriales bacterium OttesenSCG-928-N13]